MATGRGSTTATLSDGRVSVGISSPVCKARSANVLVPCTLSLADIYEKVLLDAEEASVQNRASMADLE